MRRMFLGLPVAAVIAVVALLFLVSRVAEARWLLRDSTGVNPIAICKDGMYIGVGHESNPGPVTVTAIEKVGGTQVFHQVYNNLPRHAGGDDIVAYSDYFLEAWDPEDVPLTAGTVITLAGGSDNPEVTVADCHVFPEGGGASGFSYQGLIHDGAQPANGLYDLHFTLWDENSGGSQIGAAVTLDNVLVTDLRFSLKLDFGLNAFSDGRARWLQMAVRPGSSSGSYTTLTPRQELLAAPYAHSLISGASILGRSVGEPVLTVQNLMGPALQLSGGMQGLVVDYAEDAGVRVESAGYDAFNVGQASAGLHVEQAVNGVVLDSVHSGLTISRTIFSGVDIRWAGSHGIEVDETGGDGIRLSDVGQTGIYIGSAGQRGIHIASTGAGHDGVLVGGAGDDGVHVSSPASNGLEVISAGFDGVHINGAGDDGIQIANTSWGLYNPPPGTTFSALLPNTAQANGEWALLTSDKIHAANVSVMGLSLVARADSMGSLQVGDVVAVSGMAEPLPGTLQPVPLVQQAGSDNGAGVIGVVQSRMALEPTPGKGEDAELLLHSTTGPAQSGDYVSLAIYGVAYVRLSSDITAEVGSRLTPATTPGAVRPLRTETIQGLTVTEGTPVIGVLLDAPDAETGLAPVFVTLR